MEPLPHYVVPDSQNIQVCVSSDSCDVDVWFIGELKAGSFSYIHERQIQDKTFAYVDENHAASVPHLTLCQQHSP